MYEDDMEGVISEISKLKRALYVTARAEMMLSVVLKIEENISKDDVPKIVEWVMGLAKEQVERNG